MKCRICSNEKLYKFLSLGNTALANRFLKEQDLYKEEPKFPLEVLLCEKCKLVQLGYVVPPQIMFDNYVYVSSTTKTFQIHFAQMAEELVKDLGLKEKSLAVDIGSNDGLLLKGFQKFDVNVIGVEPASNVAKIAQANGIDTINDFFSRTVVEKIISMKGRADVVTATNVFAHINDIDDVVENVKMLTKEDGVFVVEFPYLVDMLQKMTFDAIYHEHLSYFAVIPLYYLFKQHGMEIFKIKKVESHGGSLRVFVKKIIGKHEADNSVEEFISNEEKIGVNRLETYEKFAKKVNEVKANIVNCIKNLKKQNKKIAAYGAPAKATTLLSFCNIGKNEIDFVIDDNTLKQGMFMPGTHIPVKTFKSLGELNPDYVLILAWNFSEEILNKTELYRKKGMRFIVPLPKLKIV